MTGKEARTNGKALIDIWPVEYLVEGEAPGYQKAMARKPSPCGWKVLR